MANWSKITVEKGLRYLFLLLTIAGGLVILLNLGAYLGIGTEGAMIRGWVNYGYRSPQPELLPMENGQIKIFNLQQIRFAFIQFNSVSDLLQGIPLVYLILKVLSELAVVLILLLLMQIFRSLDKGEVFQTQTLFRIRLMAYAVLTYTILTFLNTHLLAAYIQGSGETFRSAYPALTNEYFWSGILVTLIILALLKAFKLGTQLQQEQDLTI